ERSKLIGRSFARFIAQKDREKFAQHLREFGIVGQMRSIEIQLQLAEERTVQVELLTSSLRPLNSPILHRTAITDITERKLAAEITRRAHDDLEDRVAEKTIELAKIAKALRAEVAQHELDEAALMQSEAKVRAIFNTVNDGIFVHDFDTGRIIEANASACQIYGYEADELKGRGIESLGAAESSYSPEEARRRFKEAAEGTPQLFEWLAKHKSGRSFWVEVNLKQAIIGGERRLLAVVRDISRRKADDLRLHEQAALLNQAQEAITVRDLEGRIQFWNAGAERMYGWTEEEALGEPIVKLIYPQDSAFKFQQANRDVIERGEWAGEGRRIKKTGAEITIESRWTLVRNQKGQPESVLAINMDITEKKKMEAQFLRSQRIEGIGALAAGIAHDINNVLSPILMAIHLLQLKFKDDDSTQLLAVLKRNAIWGGEMAKQILEFARGTQGGKMLIQPAHLIKETLALLEKTLPKSIEIRSSIPHNLWPMSTDPTQFHQVLINLFLNARDAMPNGGKIMITAENLMVDEHYARMHAGLTPGRYVAISVEDTGCGIPPEIIHRIFEPFFTTKEPGKGTGLGLSTVQGIVKNHGGSLSVRSELNQGAVFRIFMPSGAPPELQAEIAKQPGEMTGHGETILLVDDEAAIREITRNVLESCGYRVLAASDGAEALALYAEHRDTIKLILVDIMMPLMDGLSMIRALRRLDRDVKVIASTGFESRKTAIECMDLDISCILSKPYTAEKLLGEISSALEV
ncbi:MAG TPA: PAS domain S-box protein, partial [Blastocatellia bacterium]|nr:PAS domain S-box protein [Blastocatellia bacterium]